MVALVLEGVNITPAYSVFIMDLYLLNLVCWFGLGLKSIFAIGTEANKTNITSKWSKVTPK